MKSNKTIVYEFVEFIPNNLKDGTIYISTTYATAVHNCCCGCHNKVVTPLSPRDWKLIFNGETISLHPSIGNWNFPCKSHYWIRENNVLWADKWDNNEPFEVKKNRDSEENKPQATAKKKRFWDCLFRKKR